MTSVEHPMPSAPKTLRSLLDRLLNWYRENRQATHDLIGLLVLSVITYFFILANDLMNVFIEFTRQHEELELDELVLTLGVVSSLYVSVFAVRRWAEAAKRLRQANTDSLTRLFNRRKGWEMIEYEIARSERYQRPLSIIMMDIDHFKTINDMHGHLAGDRVLRAMAKVAREAIRSIDSLIRWGGEEFIVLLPDTELEAALPVAERLREAIAGMRVTVPDEELSITASLGVARKDENTLDLETLVARVDQALYIAKFRGRNRVATSK
jgi:diguanylate cyclase (GGDEF)-like protein